MDKIQELFTELDFIRNYNRKLDNNYNIFRVLDIENREVLICRFLADLLNPRGNHKQGTRYLKTFLQDVLGMRMQEKELSCFRVYKEYPITKDRRIDIVIQGQEYFIPIEVKIHAGEQPGQCYDYYHYAKEKDSKTKIVYLTKWGTPPSEFSLKSIHEDKCLLRENVICISFAEDICNWLERELQYENNEINQILRQYLDAIYTFTRDMGKEIQVKVVDRILENEQYFQVALEVERSMKQAKAKLIYKVLQEFEQQLAPMLFELELEREKRFSWYEYEEQATEDFYNHYSTYPGINYVVKRAKLPQGMELWFRIEVEYVLYAGLCIFDTNKKSEYNDENATVEQNHILETEVSKYLTVQEMERDSWFLKWWYLPTGTENYRMNENWIPNFKEMNEAAVSLVDEGKLRSFVEESIQVIRCRLKEILRS